MTLFLSISTFVYAVVNILAGLREKKKIPLLTGLIYSASAVLFFLSALKNGELQITIGKESNEG